MRKPRPGRGAGAALYCGPLLQPSTADRAHAAVHKSSRHQRLVTGNRRPAKGDSLTAPQRLSCYVVQPNYS